MNEETNEGFALSPAELTKRLVDLAQKTEALAAVFAISMRHHPKAHRVAMEVNNFLLAHPETTAPVRTAMHRLIAGISPVRR